MGEYEPNDSRDVTQKPGHEPGGLDRTGPREDAARREAEKREQQKSVPARKGEQMRQVQQQGVQVQSQSGSQSQTQTREEQAELEQEANELNASPEGPLAGNQPQAGNTEGGEARPVWDQYEVNSPSAMQQPQQVGADRQREQARAQREQSGADADQRSVGGHDAAVPGEGPDAEERGYGGAGEEREDAAKD